MTMQTITAEPPAGIYDEKAEPADPFKLNWDWNNRALTESDEEALAPLFGLPGKQKSSRRNKHW